METSSLKNFEKLLGTWKLSGDASGTIRYEFLEGRAFLIQHVDMEYAGRRIKGQEIIGRIHRIEEEPSQDVVSRFYSYFDGLTLDYVYQMEGNRLTIWFGTKDSGNFMTSDYNADGQGFAGAWQWPGGGYSFRGARIS